MIMPNRLVHLELHTGDLARACAFYSRLCGWTPEQVHARGVAIVAAAAARRGPDPAQLNDDLDDPWGRGDQTFIRIGDEIEDTVVPFATLLIP